jgi:hypothetical protein
MAGKQRAKSRGGRPRKPDHERLGVQIALRIDPGLLDRIDGHIDRLRSDHPAVAWSRGSAIRDLMLKGLAVTQAEATRNKA